MAETIGTEGVVLELPSCTQEELIQRLEDGGLWLPSVQLAIGRALETHGEQLVNHGTLQPYLEGYTFPVAAESLSYVQARKKSPARQLTVVTSALIYRSIEDGSNFDIESCRNEFGNEVGNIVSAVTKVGRSEDIYLSKLTNSHKYSQIIKIIEVINDLKRAIVKSQSDPSELATQTIEASNYEGIADLILDVEENDKLNKELYMKLKIYIDLGRAALCR
jgi:hypothetical protein